MASLPDWIAFIQDRYRVEREIGRGGTAQVYLAEELEHHRPVAIKILLEELARAVGPDRFLREVEVAARLGHPNILPLLASGTIPPSEGRPARPYFVMPFVEGESLRQRLTRGRCSLREALDVTRPVAAALDHAHARGIIHRDVKPANILLTGGTAIVADFGIARALDRSTTDSTLTATGLIIGTPGYMPPEQSGSGEAVDARTDVYALGCVVYEMLAGAPPFVADNALTLLARHRLDSPPPLDQTRPDLPAGVAETIHRALAKVQDERFASAGAFADALRDSAELPSASRPGPAAARRPARRHTAWLASAGALLVLIAVLASGVLRKPVATAAATADTNRIAILPPEQLDTDRGAIVEGLLRDGFARWSGISVADGFQVRDQLDRRHIKIPRDADDAAAVALGVGAGRMVRSVANRSGATLRIEATLFDSRTRADLARGTVAVDTSLQQAEAALASLADSLVLAASAGGARRIEPSVGAQGYGTRSVPAIAAFWRGQRALQDWNLPAADSAFSDAMAADRPFAEAALSLALVRSWKGQPTSSWSGAARQAWAGRDVLTTDARTIASALVARADADMAAACARWQALARTAPRDFMSWYGLGDCLASDRAVEQDPRSASGWRFRTSYHAALAAYQRAFALVPSTLRALREQEFQSARRLFMTSLQSSRIGRNARGERFIAVPAWAGDTLALVPWPVGGDAAAVAPPRANTPEAVGHQRRLYFETVSSWVAAYPDDPDALTALAQALELRVDTAALDTLRRARQLATLPSDRLQLGAMTVRMMVKRAIPDDTTTLRQAMRLADSLLANNQPTDPTGEFDLAVLGALTGRAHVALEHLRRPGVGALLEAPPGMAATGPSLEMLAAFGRPTDSLATLERAVHDYIELQLLPSDRPSARIRWLARPVTLAYPDYVSPLLSSLRGQGDYFLDAIASLVDGDTAEALAPLEEVADWRSATGNSTVSVDQLPSLASLYALTGRTSDATQLLDATLLHLFGSGPDALTDPVRAASLGRAVALRAEFAVRAGDAAAARRWATVLDILWHDADPALRPVVSRAGRLAGGAADAAERGGPTRRR